MGERGRNAIKLVVFDLDGVLVDSRDLHYHALNAALSEIDPKFAIARDHHLAVFDGLPTSRKLDLLTERFGLPKSCHSQVWASKQRHTCRMIASHISPRPEHVSLMKALRARGIKVYCASNSIWATVKDMLTAAGLITLVDYFASNEEVRNPKPDPAIYLHCIARAGVSVHETLVCEDSPVGRTSALRSGAHLCPIIDPADLTVKKVMDAVDSIQVSPSMDLRWKRPLRVVIPMAGRGSRFASVGYTVPKPLIPVLGKPMIQRVVENLGMDAEFVYIVQQAHLNAYNLAEELTKLTPGCKIIAIDGITEGAACTVLCAESVIDDSKPLLIANSDQFVEWSGNEFMYAASGDTDGTILTFHCPDRSNKWSYVRVDDNGFVVDLKEKTPISSIATVGIYYWSHGSDFVKYAKRMIAENERVNGEFYVAPVYMRAIKEGLKFRTFQCKAMHGLGTPEDLTFFLARHADLLSGP